MAPTLTTEKVPSVPSASSSTSSSLSSSAVRPLGSVSSPCRPGDEDNGLLHARGMLQAMHEMQQLHEMCDMQVVAEGEPIQVHSLVLAACSTYFRSLLCTSKSGDWQTLDMPRISKANLKVLITYAYTGKLDLGAHNVKEILHTSLLYGFAGAAQICEQFVQREGKEKAKRGLNTSKSTSQQESARRTSSVIQVNSEAVLSRQKKNVGDSEGQRKQQADKGRQKSMAHQQKPSLPPQSPAKQSHRSLPERQRHDFQILQQSQNRARASLSNNEPVALLKKFVQNELDKSSSVSQLVAHRSQSEQSALSRNPHVFSIEEQPAALDLTNSSSSRKRKTPEAVSYPSKSQTQSRTIKQSECSPLRNTQECMGLGVAIVPDISKGANVESAKNSMNSANAASSIPSKTNKTVNIVQRSCRSKSNLVRKENLSNVIMQKKLSLEHEIDHLIEKAQRNQKKPPPATSYNSQPKPCTPGQDTSTEQHCVSPSKNSNSQSTALQSVPVVSSVKPPQESLGKSASSNTSNDSVVSIKKQSLVSTATAAAAILPPPLVCPTKEVSKKTVKNKQKSSKRNASGKIANKTEESIDKFKFGRKPFLRSQRVDLKKKSLFDVNRSETRTEEESENMLQHSESETRSGDSNEISAEFLRAMNLKRNPVKQMSSHVQQKTSLEFTHPTNCKNNDSEHDLKKDKSDCNRCSEKIHPIETRVDVCKPDKEKHTPKSTQTEKKNNATQIDKSASNKSYAEESLDDSGICMTAGERDIGTPSKDKEIDNNVTATDKPAQENIDLEVETPVDQQIPVNSETAIVPESSKTNSDSLDQMKDIATCEEFNQECDNIAPTEKIGDKQTDQQTQSKLDEIVSSCQEDGATAQNTSLIPEEQCAEPHFDNVDSVETPSHARNHDINTSKDTASDIQELHNTPSLVTFKEKVCSDNSTITTYETRPTVDIISETSVSEPTSSSQMLDDAHLVLTSLEILNNSDNLSSPYMNIVNENHMEENIIGYHDSNGIHNDVQSDPLQTNLGFQDTDAVQESPYVHSDILNDKGITFETPESNNSISCNIETVDFTSSLPIKKVTETADTGKTISDNSGHYIETKDFIDQVQNVNKRTTRLSTKGSNNLSAELKTAETNTIDSSKSQKIDIKKSTEINDQKKGKRLRESHNLGRKRKIPEIKDDDEAMPTSSSKKIKTNHKSGKRARPSALQGGLESSEDDSSKLNQISKPNKPVKQKVASSKKLRQSAKKNDSEIQMSTNRSRKRTVTSSDKESELKSVGASTKKKKVPTATLR